MPAPVPAPPDPLVENAARLVDELRSGDAVAAGDAAAETLLVDGYAAALALEAARRRLRGQALELCERELRLEAQERTLRAELRTLRRRLAAGGGAGAPTASDDEAAAQRVD